LRSKLLIRLALSLAVAFLGLELVLRVLLFGTGDLAQSVGRRLRQARYYAELDTDAYWALDGQFRTETRDAPRHPDARLGWLSRDVAPATYEHTGLGELDSRRPILLYGDSFSACMTNATDCFQGLLARSSRDDSHVLLNHGVSGHGPGQMLLMLRSTAPRLVDLNPLVVVGIFVDDDLERTALSLRQFPKPRFYLEDGELAYDPPHPGGRQAWLEAHGEGITSYAWRLLTTDGPRHTPSKEALNRAVLAAIRDELARLDLEGFVILFPGLKALRAEPGMDWQEPFLRRTLNELGLPFVDARRDLEAEARRSGDGVEAFFIPSGPATGHYDARGNEVAFRALVRGLEGEFD